MIFGDWERVSEQGVINLGLEGSREFVHIRLGAENPGEGKNIYRGLGVGKSEIYVKLYELRYLQ